MNEITTHTPNNIPKWKHPYALKIIVITYIICRQFLFRLDMLEGGALFFLKDILLIINVNAEVQIAWSQVYAFTILSLPIHLY